MKKLYLFSLYRCARIICLASLIIIFTYNCVSAQEFTSVTWSTALSQPYTVSEAQGRVVNGKLYSFGGFDSQKSTFTPTKHAYVYNPSTNTWTPIADLPFTPNGTNFGGVTHAGITTDGTNIFIAGGYTSNAAGTGQIFGTKQVWKYVISLNSYSRLPDLPINIAAGQLEYLNGRLHYIGGTNSARTEDLGNHYVLDLGNLTAGWKTLASLPNPRHHAGSAVYGGKIFFIGGQHGHDQKLVTQKEVDIYNPLANTWTRAADLPVPSGASGRGHISSGVVIADNRIIVLGGETVHGTSINIVSAFNSVTNSWASLTPLPVNRFSGVAGWTNGTLYYTGGSYSKATYKGVPVAPVSQRVDSLVLINADTEKPIRTITDGAIINLATLPTRNLNIRASTTPTTVGSVVFSLSGPRTRTVKENVAPYTLFGDNGNGDYYSWTPLTGNYTLKATPFSASSGGGTAGRELTIAFTVTNTTSQTSTLSPIADAYVRNGSYASTNYGAAANIIVKGTTADGYLRNSYLKFPLNGVSSVVSAKLRIYGYNADNTSTIAVSTYGITNDSWTESGITYNNAPAASTAVLSSAGTNNQAKYLEFDVTGFVKGEFATDKVVSFLVRDPNNQNANLAFNSKENDNNRPELIISSSQGIVLSSADNVSTAPFNTINSNKELKKSVVYPNPVHSNFKVLLAATYRGNLGFTLTDQGGRSYNLGSRKITNGQQNISFDITGYNLRSGVYFLKIVSETKNEEIKLIIQ